MLMVARPAWGVAVRCVRRGAPSVGPRRCGAHRWSERPCELGAQPPSVGVLGGAPLRCGRVRSSVRTSGRAGGASGRHVMARGNGPLAVSLVGRLAEPHPGPPCRGGRVRSGVGLFALFEAYPEAEVGVERSPRTPPPTKSARTPRRTTSAARPCPRPFDAAFPGSCVLYDSEREVKDLLRSAGFDQVDSHFITAGDDPLGWLTLGRAVSRRTRVGAAFSSGVAGARASATRGRVLASSPITCPATPPLRPGGAF